MCWNKTLSFFIWFLFTRDLETLTKPSQSQRGPHRWKVEGTFKKLLQNILYPDNESFEKLSMLDKSFSILKRYVYASISLQSAIQMFSFALILLCCLTVKGWFPNGGLLKDKIFFCDIRTECEIDFKEL